MAWRRTSSSNRNGRVSNRFHNNGGFRGRYENTNFSLSYLKDLTNLNSNKILNVLSKNKDSYSEVFTGTIDNDLLRAITKVNVKICESTYIADKYKILKITVCKRFIESWKNRINDMSNLSSVLMRRIINEDVNDILIIFQNALDLMPSLCWYQVQSIINIIITIKERCNFSESVTEKCNKLKEKIDYFEKRFSRGNRQNSAVSPIDDFHTINVFPTTQELVTRERNFVRTNIVTGAYDSVAHYLDVLFRLQREDFLNPIREDLCDYINEIHRPFFNIKIYDEITFFGETCHRDDMCYTIEIKLNKKNEKRLKNDNQKKFMTGSLLLFTDNDFKTIIRGQVVDSKAVSRGELVVSFEDTFPTLKRSYKMVECTVFFDPYYQVLKVLQTIDTNELPMGDYIVKVETSSVKRPAYLPLSVPIPKVTLNKSQEKAFNAAFTQEFVVIQGPPGTGKTFLGLTITKQLLQFTDGPILVICYTNHALDQFLEGLLPATKKLVRLGSQSKNKVLQEQTLRRMRRELHVTPMVKWEREIIEQSAERIKGIDRLIKLLREPVGIVNLKFLPAFLIDSFTEEYLFVWLLQDTTTCSVDDEDGHLREIYWNYLKMIKSKTNYLVSPADMRGWLNYISTSINDMLLEIDSVNAAFIQGEIPEEEYKYYLTFYKSEIDLYQEDHHFILKKIDFLTKQLEKNNYDSSKTYQMNDPSILSTDIRWHLYNLWLQETEEMLQIDKRQLIANYREAYAGFRELMEDADVATLRNIDIIGMTTSCAARMHSTLQRVGCRIVVVEEAAEVVEAHIVTALTKECQHLILLGDHQQLKPNTADYVIEKQYNLGVSLFERMVKNNIQCHTLNVQHRMRPEIASLITPVIYPDLKNSPSVMNYPNVRGVEKSLFFISHDNPEQKFGESSKLNKFEAQYLVKLAEYLLKVGYKPEEVTILAAYAGQVVTINQEIAKNKYKVLEKVYVTTVDNFQGEESKIILLSLVRNNDNESVGFLKIENRICVALSRAKEGFYIMGNLKLLQHASDIWKQIKQTLKNLDAKGRSLPLFCENHKTVTKIRNIEDFEKVPEGGCDKDCHSLLKCGHTCQRKCHLDDLCHETYKCLELCLRKICDNYSSHSLCKKCCYEKCGTCQHLVKVTLNCGHDQNVPCGDSKNLVKVNCMFKETVSLPCGHNLNKLCHETLLSKKCNKMCKKLLTCGHSCLKPCHYDSDPEHVRYKCEVQCQKANLYCKKFGKKHFSLLPCHQQPSYCNAKSTQLRKECSHLYTDIPCHKDVNNIKCTKTCKKELPCGHACRKTCSEYCGPCAFETPQQAECGHWFNTICGNTLLSTKCTKPCDKNLPCGHKCPNKCYEMCKATNCTSICSKKLECGHVCIARCGKPCVCLKKQIPECLHKILIKCTEEPMRKNCKQCMQEDTSDTDSLTLETLRIYDDREDMLMEYFD